MTSPPAPTRGLYGWFARHTRLVDAAVASTLLLVTVVPYLVFAAVDLTGVADGGTRTILTSLVLSLVLVVPLFWRRAQPVRAAAVVAGACVVQLALGTGLLPAQLAVLLVIAALAGYGPRWASLGGLALGAVGILLLAVQTTLGNDTPGVWVVGALMTAFGWSLIGVAWLSGDLTRARRHERAALADRAERIERERERDLRLAAADERARIAREMHDVIAHSLTIIVTQADGARYAAPAAAGPVVPALEAIAETARTSLAETRRLLGVLREDDDAPTAPTPTVHDLPALVATARDAGLLVAFSESGRPDAHRLTAGIGLVVYRIVQESLTNIRKHAGAGSRAEIRVEWDEDAVALVVEDDGPGLPGDAASRGGHGLTGMRERIALYGGTLRLGRSSSGGAAVAAVVPLPADGLEIHLPTRTEHTDDRS